MKKVADFFGDLKTELGKVSWSSPRDLTKAAIVVLAGTFCLTVIIFVIDIAFSNGLKFIIK